MSLTSRHLDRLEERFGELLGARASSRVDFSEYADDPVRFLREVIGFEPTPKQVEVCLSVLENKRTVARGHHGAGKDAILAALLLWAAYARNMLCVVISATERQVLGQVWAEVARRWTETGIFAGELYVGELRIGGEKRIMAMTSASTSRLTGYHNHRGTGVFVAISESQSEQVGEVAFDAAEGNTAGSGSRIVVVGNPVKASGRFFESSRKPTWSAVRMSAFDHPNVVEGRVVIPGGPSPTWPAEMEAEYGLESAFYVSRVLAEFPAEGSVDSLTSRRQVEDAIGRHDAGVPLSPRAPLALSLDVARSLDRDENVAALSQGVVVHQIHAWRSRDLVDTASRFLAIADEVSRGWARIGAPGPELVVDTPGIGGGVVDILRAKDAHVHEWWGWNPASDPKRFANLRAAAYWRLRLLLEKGEVYLPRDEQLIEEVVAMEWSQDPKGRIIMLDKETLRKKLGRSPDRADAVVMSLGIWEAVRTVRKFVHLV